MNIPQCVHPIFDGHLSGFVFASVVNNAAMTILFMFFGLCVPGFLSGQNRMDNSQ